MRKKRRAAEKSDRDREVETLGLELQAVLDRAKAVMDRVCVKLEQQSTPRRDTNA